VDCHDFATVGHVWLERPSPLQVQKVQLCLVFPHFVSDVDHHDSAIVVHVWLESLVSGFLPN
jgi:hypothetical protein